MRMLGVATVLALLLGGCTAAVPASPAGPALAGTAWVVTHISGDPTLADYQPTMNFGDNGQLNGDNGCNLYTTTYKQSGSSLTIAEPAQTMMACTDAGRGKQERDFTAALTAVMSARTAGDGVELLDQTDGVVLLLGPVPAVSLAGTKWELAGVVQGSTTSVPVAGSKVTMEFSDDTISGKACNTFTGGYTLKDDSLTVSTMAVTAMACTNTAVMQQEQFVLGVLDGTSTVSQQHGVLVITDPDGRGLQLTKA